MGGSDERRLEYLIVLGIQHLPDEMSEDDRQKGSIHVALPRPVETRNIHLYRRSMKT
jgi:hypothetical protein